MSREKKNTKSPFAGIIEIPSICHKNSKTFQLSQILRQFKKREIVRSAETRNNS